MSSTTRFQRYLLVGLLIAAAAWLLVAIVNYRESGRISFAGLAVLVVVLVAVTLIRKPR